MQTNAIPTWKTRAVTFALAALAALSASYWGLKSLQPHSVASAAATPATMAALGPQAVARVLGGGSSAATAGQNAGSPATGRTPYVLVGVLAEGAKSGAALIAVDGKPAKPYPVGAVVDGQLVLQSVAARRATLALGLDGPAQITLELPALGK